MKKQYIVTESGLAVENVQSRSKTKPAKATKMDHQVIATILFATLVAGAVLAMAVNFGIS